MEPPRCLMRFDALVRNLVAPVLKVVCGVDSVLGLRYVDCDEDTARIARVDWCLRGLVEEREILSPLRDRHLYPDGLLRLG